MMPVVDRSDTKESTRTSPPSPAAEPLSLELDVSGFREPLHRVLAIPMVARPPRPFPSRKCAEIDLDERRIRHHAEPVPRPAASLTVRCVLPEGGRTHGWDGSGE